MLYEITQENALAQDTQGLEFICWSNGKGYFQSESALNAPFVEIEALPLEVERQLQKELREAKAYLKEQLNEQFKIAIDTLVAEIPQSEVLSWNMQEAEARAYIKSKKEADAKMLKVLAAQRGIDLQTLATKVVQKADLYKQASAALIGKRQALEDAIDSASKIEALGEIAINFAAGE